MAKHQADERLILVKHEPGEERKRKLFLVTAMVVIGVIGFLVGSFQIKYRHNQAIEQLTDLSSDFTQLQESEAVLRQQVANLESGRKIDNLAKVEIQETIKSLKFTVSLLKKDVRFYQNIMAPSDNARGLQVQKAEISKAQGENRFDYKIVLAQVAGNKAYVQGVAAVNLVGTQEGKVAILPLRDISDEKELGIKFRFRYFQNIDGELTLPEGFSPQEIQVVAQSKGKKASRVEHAFVWSEVVQQAKVKI